MYRESEEKSLGPYSDDLWKHIIAKAGERAAKPSRDALLSAEAWGGYLRQSCWRVLQSVCFTRPEVIYPWLWSILSISLASSRLSSFRGISLICGADLTPTPSSAALRI